MNMRKLVCTASLALSFFAVISVKQAMANSANADVCQQAMRPATTGGATRQNLEAAMKCRRQAATNSQSTSQQPGTETKARNVDSSKMPGMNMDGSTMPSR
jgi:hypothetical protein